MKRVCDQRYQYARLRRKKRRLRKRFIRRMTILGIGCIGIILVVMLWNQIFFEKFEDIFFVILPITRIPTIKAAVTETTCNNL